MENYISEQALSWLTGKACISTRGLIWIEMNWVPLNYVRCLVLVAGQTKLEPRAMTANPLFLRTWWKFGFGIQTNRWAKTISKFFWKQRTFCGKVCQQYTIFNLKRILATSSWVIVMSHGVLSYMSMHVAWVMALLFFLTWHMCKDQYVSRHRNWTLKFASLLREAIGKLEQRYLIKDFQTHAKRNSFGVNHVLVSTSLCWGDILVEGCRSLATTLLLCSLSSISLSHFPFCCLPFVLILPWSFVVTGLLDSNTCSSGNIRFTYGEERRIQGVGAIPGAVPVDTRPQKGALTVWSDRATWRAIPLQCMTMLLYNVFRPSPSHMILSKVFFTTLELGSILIVDGTGTATPLYWRLFDVLQLTND